MKKTFVTSLTLSSALAISAMTAQASENPFSAKSLNQGYQIASADKMADGKCGEGKCGAMKKKDESSDAHEKKAEGSCGGKEKKAEGSCGATEKKSEGSCGGKEKKAEGSCGAKG